MAISKYQFNAPDADITLMADDMTEFHVHRSILSAASGFFSDMFTLPQPAGSCAEGKRPVVPVFETADVLDNLLRFTYPIPDPIISSLDELIPVLGAAIKFDFEIVVVALRKLLVAPRFVETYPLRVYAIACRYDLDDEAKQASRYTLDHDVVNGPLCDDFKHVTAFQYHRLIELHRRRADAAVRLLKIPEEIKCMQCNGSAFTIHGSPKWWYDFETRAKEELLARPTTNVVFEMEFLAQAAIHSNCTRCAGSVLDAWRWLGELKSAIDSLPATI
ncbi:hypothetical protein BDQ17DRAFT_1427242 [Cyathus striatus]|nr:hypothetical protein BDQ17DRAFT_1427242 [Cyathus striatus]